MTNRRRLTRVAFLVSLCLAAAPSALPLSGQSGQSGQSRHGEPDEGQPLDRESHLQVYAYALQHKPAAEALPLIRPLLSKRGTVELQPQGNTLVVRDTLAALGRIVPSLRAYDRPAQDLRVQVIVVRAYSRPVPIRPERSLPDWLEERLRGLLRWDYYQVLADSDLDTQEGQGVVHEIGSQYGVRFRMGTLTQDERIKLHDFRVWRVPTGEEKPLLEATLNLWLDKPKVLGLANSESSDQALMVVLTCERVVRATEPGAASPEEDG